MFEQSSREEVDKALGCGTFSVAERGFEPDGIRLQRRAVAGGQRRVCTF